MKFFAVLAATSIAVTSAANCDLTKITPVILAANNAQLDKIPGLCKSTACRAFLKELKTAAPTECTVTISTPPLELYAELINPLEKTCGLDPAAPATTTAKPDDKATTVPPTTTAKPNAKESTEGGSQKEAGSAATPSPAPVVTPAPTPAPTPGPAPATASSGLNPKTIAAASGAKHDKLDEPMAPASGVYAAMSNAPTDDDTVSGSDLLPGGMALAVVRIPYKALLLETVISQGGYGEVFQGIYNTQVVAIKRLLASRRKDPQSIRSFFKEIQLTATLEHECIVKFIGVAWDIPANLSMVSEFMDGGDLRTMLVDQATRGRPHGHDDHKLWIAVQVAHALTYLHTLSTPVVHRDLKSRNILLSAEGNAKLIDFGISCERQDVTMTAGVGTSLWMAPEVMLGKRYDEKADVFSFGVILSELDTHELPYDHARDPMSDRKMANMVLMQRISDGRLKPRFTEFAHPEIVALANDCLQVNPRMRPLASEVLYRIHTNLQHDHMVTNETRDAIRSSILTIETIRTRTGTLRA